MKGTVNMTDAECVVILGREVARLTERLADCEAERRTLEHLLGALRITYNELDRAYLALTTLERKP